jgi:hypothetical protein
VYDMAVMVGGGVSACGGGKKRKPRKPRK